MQPPIRVSAPAERLAASGLASAVTSAQIPPDEPARARRTPTALWWSLAFIVLLCLIALFAPLLAPYSPNEQLDIVGLKTRPPSFAHPLGTDQYSRDLLSRLLFGARISLSVAMLAVLLSATVGTAYGLVAGYLGGRVDAIMMRLLDACLSIPRVLLLVALLALWSPVPLGALIAIIGFTGWFEVSRLVRAEVLSVMQRDYALAARALGTPGLRIVWRHVLPNVLTPVFVAATLGVANVIILEAGLSYLGIGARAPTASWGSIFFDGSDAFQTTWWIALFPGLAIIMTVLAFNVFGTALRDALDPHQLAGGDAR
ncbi:MAG: peptide ABC transporter permease [Gemmatimonadetes bacterium]|nr:MAG: peptide ABC transporter permease [Gemmatimonadota bacterium]